MSTTHELPDAEILDLEPTAAFQVEWEGADPLAEPGQGIALKDGSTTIGLFNETEALRKTRLGAASLLLTVVYAILTVWSFAWGSKGVPVIPILGACRFLLAAGVLAALLSPLASSVRRVRVLEILLFGGLTLLPIASQYVVNAIWMERSDLPSVIATVKNGVLEMVLLMFLYGTFIPNRPKTVAWVAMIMAFGNLLGLTLLSERPEFAEIIEDFFSVEPVGTNAVFLLVGVGMAVFGSTVLNGLRKELHQARKFGQYHLIRKLGEGGMGEVYLAEHALLKRPCALKLIRPEANADPLAQARFEREVQSSARLSHHNVIAIYDYGHTNDGTFYYVMEYLNGMSLGDMVKGHGPLSHGRLIHLFRQVCAGLAEAHALGLIHRDLKPGNIYVARVGGEPDVAKVLDFGLVKITNDTGSTALTAETTVSGTPLYMAPEQAVGDKHMDQRADIYALGAVMYHAATGQPPFEGDNPLMVMMAHARDPIVPPSQIRPDLPSDLEAVILTCLSKKADERYASVRELSLALASCSSAREWDTLQADAWWSDKPTTPPPPSARG
jgi:serine/threonine-protein kinase